MTKRNIEDLEVGDKVVINPPGERTPYKIGTVKKVTATQLTVDGTRFSRRDGVKIGDGSSYSYRTQLAQVWGKGLMTIEEAEQRNQEIQLEKEVALLASKIVNARLSHLRTLPVEVLREAVFLLGLEAQ
jgi:hypothetical protein